MNDDERCPEIVCVHGRRMQCHWPRGHRGDGADLFSFHAARYQTGEADVLITWRDGEQPAQAESMPKPRLVRRRSRVPVGTQVLPFAASGGGR